MNLKVLAGIAIIVLIAGVSGNSISNIAFAQMKSSKEVRDENQQVGKQKAYEGVKEAHEKTTQGQEPYKGPGGAASTEDVKEQKMKAQDEMKTKTIADKKESNEKTVRELKPYPKQGIGAPEDVKAKKLKDKEALEEQSFSNAKDSHQKTITKLIARR